MVTGLIQISLYWDSERVEQAALSYALNWKGVPELGRQLDRADDYCSAWTLERIETVASWESGSEPVRAQMSHWQNQMAILLQSLRQRVQFIQSRAADLRLTGKLEELSKMLMEREEKQINEAILKMLTEVSSEMSAQGENELRLLREIELRLQAIQEKHPEVKLAEATDFHFPEEVRRQIKMTLTQEAIQTLTAQLGEHGMAWAAALFEAMKHFAV